MEHNRRSAPSREREVKGPAHVADEKKSGRTETASELASDEGEWLYLTTSDPAFLLGYGEG